MPEETRGRIVDAAWRVLERDGLAAASIKSIASEAGVAQGLVHYYFESKEVLVIAALNKCCAQLGVAGPGGDAAAMARSGFDAARARTPEKMAARRVLVEMAGRALHDDSIRSALLVYLREQRQRVQEQVGAVIADAKGVSPALVRSAGPAIDAALFGIWAVGLIDPAFDTDQAIDALAEISLRAISTIHSPAEAT